MTQLATPMMRYGLDLAPSWFAADIKQHQYLEGINSLYLNGCVDFAPEGRPDGERPLNFDSYYDLYAEKRNESTPVLTDQQCCRLLEEAYLYFRRGLDYLRKSHFLRAQHDLKHVLKIIDLGDRATTDNKWRMIFHELKPHYEMMHYVLLAAVSLQQHNRYKALRWLRQGIGKLNHWASVEPDAGRYQAHLLCAIADELSD